MALDKARSCTGLDGFVGGGPELGFEFECGTVGWLLFGSSLCHVTGRSVGKWAEEATLKRMKKPKLGLPRMKNEEVRAE